MIIRVWFKIALLMASAYGAYGVLDQASVRFTPSHWQFYFYAIAPWALLLGSIKAWHRSYIWRCMLDQRQTSPALSRGGHRTDKTTRHPSILEHFCFFLLILAIAAILKQLSAAHIEWWIGSFLGAWFVLRFTLKKVS